MLNDERQSQSLPGGDRPFPAAVPVTRTALLHWFQQVLEPSQAQVKVRLRGNNLYVLCESRVEPDPDTIARLLTSAFAARSLETLLPPGAPDIHRLICYGRIRGQSHPAWSRELGVTNPSAPALTAPTPAADPTALLELARQGDPSAIAQSLSQALSALGIGIRAKLDKPSTSQPAGLKRLLILCESGYTPDPSLLAAPITQRLRELELTQFRDAVVFGQVSGEHQPEWMVRVDLTPPDEMLREWAHWGDVQAIARLLNRTLQPQAITLTALLKDVTLHLSCTQAGGTVPDQTSTIASVVPTLQALTPQGIQSAVLYGAPQFMPATPADTSAGWVHLIDLAAPQSEQAVTTLDRAKQGDLRSLTFLLTRLLNPDLDGTLATGGTRVQIRQKGDLLHILTEAPNCPRQDTVVPAIGRCLKPLQIAGVVGVRLYGRRSGQKQPLWHYGMDFGSRQQSRLVPEATPEFAASDAHVEELLSPPGAIVRWSELPDEGLTASIKRLYAQTIEGVQRSLIRTQLFIPIENPALTSSLVPVTAAAQGKRQRLQVALLWTAIGALLVFQADWLLGYWLRQTTEQAKLAQPLPPVLPSPTPPATLPDLGLKPARPTTGFNAQPFTQPGDQPLVPEATAPGELPASPLLAKASTLLPQGEAYPSFNSRQLDAQVALYRQYLEIHGAPDVLVVGSSRALRGIDPAALETALAQQGYADVKVFNFGINGATAQVVDLVLRQMLPQDQLPKLILFADGARAFNSGRQDITHNGVIASAGYKAMVAGNPPIPTNVATKVPEARSQGNRNTSENGTALPTNIYQQWNEALNERVAGWSNLYAQRDRFKTQLREQFTALLPQELTTSEILATSDSLIDSSPVASAAGTGTGAIADGQNWVDIDGFLPLSVQFNPITYYQKYARVAGDYDSDYDAFTLQGGQTDAMIEIAAYTQERNIPLVFVNLPLTQEYLDPIRKRHEDEFQKHMLQLATQHGFFYRNLGNAFLTKPRYFSDPSHLNRYGAYAVSQRLAQDVMMPWQVTR